MTLKYELQNKTVSLKHLRLPKQYFSFTTLSTPPRHRANRTKTNNATNSAVRKHSPKMIFFSRWSLRRNLRQWWESTAI